MDKPRGQQRVRRHPGSWSQAGSCHLGKAGAYLHTPRGQRSPLPCPCLGHPEPGQAFRKESRLLFRVKVTRPLLPSSPVEHPRFTSSSYTCSGANVTLQLCKSPPKVCLYFFVSLLATPLSLQDLRPRPGRERVPLQWTHGPSPLRVPRACFMRRC